MKSKSLFRSARDRVLAYDKLSHAARYNRAARTAYEYLATGRIPRSARAWDALIDALIAFDMARQLGARNSPRRRRFIVHLKEALRRNARRLRILLKETVSARNVRRHRSSIESLFDDLSRRNGVSAGKRFVVGSTKILHFLNPSFFPMVDRWVASRLNRRLSALPRNAYQYRGADYVRAMQVIATDIPRYGLRRLRQAQPGQPTLRIVDKILFMSR